MVGLYLQGTVGIQIGTRGGNSIDIWDWGGGVFISSSGFYTPPINTWIHIAYTWDGTTHRLYQNGTFVTSTTTAVTAGVLTLIYINGFPSGGASETSDTIIDDVAYYNRALNAAEVSTIASLRGTRDSIRYGAIARYAFNEQPPGNSLTTVVDYSGNGNTLTPTGAGSPVTYIAGIIDLDDRPVLG